MSVENKIINAKRKKPLWEDILKFSRGKYYLAAILIILGLIGLVIPVIPGLLLIIMAIALFKPGLMVQIRRKLNSIFKKS